MKDHPGDQDDEGITVAGVRGPLRLEDALFVAHKANRIGTLQLLRADRVMGIDHLRSAAMHAARAFREGRNQAQSLDVEFLRYVAGERQIKHAIAKMGLPDPADAAVVVGLGAHRKDAVAYFVDTLGLKEDDALIDADPAALDHFVTAAALAATPPERHLDLVLEKVAEVDMLK